MSKKALLIEIDADLKERFAKSVPNGRSMTSEIETFIKDYVTQASSTGRVRVSGPIQRSLIEYTLVPGPCKGDEAAVALFRVAGEAQSLVLRFSISGTLEALLRIHGHKAGGGSLGPVMIPFYEWYLEEKLAELSAAAPGDGSLTRKTFSSADFDIVSRFLATGNAAAPQSKAAAS
jgi:hypothetical protein